MEINTICDKIVSTIYSTIIYVLLANAANVYNSIPINVTGCQHVDFRIFTSLPPYATATLPGACLRNFEEEIRPYSSRIEFATS